ncbi:hypothetical protein ACLMAB_22095 [Brevibacillus laterosporus]
MSSNKFTNLDEQSNQTLKHLQTLPDHKLDAESKQHMLAHLLREEKKICTEVIYLLILLGSVRELCAVH